MTPDEVRSLLFREVSQRSKQRAVGPSEIGGCRRRVWEKLHGTPVTNVNTLSMAASMGTAFHTWIEDRLRGNDRFLLEQKRERDGIRGTIDCFDLEQNMVIDWKTLKLSGVPYFPSKQQRWQVQIYGWLLSPDFPVESVCLVGFPKDGSDRDIVTHVESFDEDVAMEALAWLGDVRGRVEPPKPEKPARKFCQYYCGYWDPSGVVGCPGG
jgi:hypothetical protein